MANPEIRLNHRLLQQVAKLERFRGKWERLSLSQTDSPEHKRYQALEKGALSGLLMDSSSPGGIFSQEITPLSSRITIENSSGNSLQTDSKQHPALGALIKAYKAQVELSLDGMLELYQIATNYPENGLNGEPQLRQSSSFLLTPTREKVFGNLSAFLVEQRLRELLSWTEEELEAGRIHPLLITASFYLLFLQISPFTRANHCLAQLLTWKLLCRNGFAFVRFEHFAPALLKRQKQCFGALRQAEKSAYGGAWETLPVWLEFFLDVLGETAEELVSRSEKRIRSSRLSPVQKQIIQVVNTHGSASRDTIASETGINLSTVKYNLSVLAAKGYLRRLGGGRTTSYTSPNVS